VNLRDGLRHRREPLAVVRHWRCFGVFPMPRNKPVGEEDTALLVILLHLNRRARATTTRRLARIGKRVVDVGDRELLFVVGDRLRHVYALDTSGMTLACAGSAMP